MAAPNKFTPVQRNILPRAPPVQGRGSNLAFPLFALIVYLIYLALLIVGPKFIRELAVELDPVFPPLWRLIGALVLFLLLALLIVYNMNSGPRAVSGPGPVRDKIAAPRNNTPVPPVHSDERPVKRAPLKKDSGKPPEKIKEEKAPPKIITYPVEVEGGIFGDTYIQLSPEKILKLRSLVVDPEYLS